MSKDGRETRAGRSTSMPKGGRDACGGKGREVHSTFMPKGGSKRLRGEVHQCPKGSRMRRVRGEVHPCRAQRAQAANDGNNSQHHQRTSHFLLESCFALSDDCGLWIHIKSDRKSYVLRSFWVTHSIYDERVPHLSDPHPRPAMSKHELRRKPDAGEQTNSRTMLKSTCRRQSSAPRPVASP